MNRVSVGERIRHETVAMERTWAADDRWRGIQRSHTAADVIRLRGAIRIEHTLARMSAEWLWHLLFHTLNASMFELARGYAETGLTVFVQLQECEFAFEKLGTARRVTSEKSAPATLTRSPR